MCKKNQFVVNFIHISNVVGQLFVRQFCLFVHANKTLTVLLRQGNTYMFSDACLEHCSVAVDEMIVLLRSTHHKTMISFPTKVWYFKNEMNIFEIGKYFLDPNFKTKT